MKFFTTKPPHNPEEEIRQDIDSPVSDMLIRKEDDIVITTNEDESSVREDLSLTPEKGILRTENLVKRYGSRTVANHVSINVTQGEIV